MDTELFKLYNKIMAEADYWERKGNFGYAKSLRQHASNLFKGE